MSKRFESVDSKRHRKRHEKYMVKKLRPITAFLNQQENLPETESTTQDAELPADYEEEADMMSAQNENIEQILTGQEEAREPQENIVGSQYNQNTPGQVVQVQATPDADIDYAEHRSSVTDIGLWTE